MSDLATTSTRLATIVRLTFIVAFTSLSFATSIQPVSAACTISGIVYRDYNNDGLKEELEPGQEDAIITAYGDDGLQLGRVTADGDGNYALPLSVDNEVRLEFTWPQNFLYSGRFGGSSPTTVTFVTCDGALTVDMGLSQPSEYCHMANPDLGTSCYVFEDQIRGPFADSPAFITFPYNATGDQAHRVLATAAQIGTTWGEGYHRSSDSFFLGAYLKRHAGFGPNATGSEPTSGGIYRIRPSTGEVSLFLDLNTLPAPFNAGANPHPANRTDCPTNAFNNCWQYDTDTYNLVGKMALGDLDISENDQELYVVNLFTQELIVIPIGSNATVPPSSQMRRYGLTGLPGLTCPAGDVRPFGLGNHDGRIYVGLVCSAESSQNLANLRAFVYSLDALSPSAGFRQELNFPLNFERGCVDEGDQNCPVRANGRARAADWRPWTGDWPAPDRDANVYPEPLLMDIVFDNQNMILGFRDRFADRLGVRQPGPFDLASTTLVNGMSAGDVLRACRNGTSWELEANGTCGGVTTGGAGNLEGPGGGEYYFHERNNPDIPADGPRRHDEISLGGLVDLPGSPEIAMTVFDPLCENCAGSPLYDGGVVWLDNQTGQRTRSYRIFNGPNPGSVPPGELIENFGKSNGLGDLEAVCGPEPLEIGNRVWEDLDLNGIQDPNEVKLGNVVLNLYMDTDGDGEPETHIAQTTTSAEGEYYFNEQNIFFNGLVPPTPNINFVDINGNNVRDDFEPVGLLPETTYEVRLDDPRNYNGGPLTPYFVTALDASLLRDGNDNMRDSDGVAPQPVELVTTTNFPMARLTTGLYGHNDHTYDFGFALRQPTLTPTPQETPGIIVDRPSLQISKLPDNPFVGPGDSVAWTITITNVGGVPATNVVVEDRVPDELEILGVPSNATVNGQLVRITIDLIAPGESVSITIDTRVRGDVLVPFIITNPANIVGGPSAEGRILSVERLPETGETPLVRWLILGAAGLGLAAAGILLARRQWGRS